jgi:5-methyltetrahydropteroyltriglutamate--homocysteine methyltransferase
MKRSSERILTTHIGSLARPTDLLDLMDAKLKGENHDPQAYEARVRSAVAEVVQKQVETGIDVVTDGEQGKSSFNAYLAERLTGFGSTRAGDGLDRRMQNPEARDFPEYYRKYFSEHMLGVGPPPAQTCVGPVKYTGQDAVQKDIEILKSALDGYSPEEVFLPAIAPGFFNNTYYPSREEFLHELGEALREEYLAIVNAGFVLQIDDPSLTRLYHSNPSDSMEQRRKGAELYVEALNYALRGIPPEQIRYHTCYGINEGPRIHDIPLKDYVGLMLGVNAGAYSFEAANPRHDHEWVVWQDVKLEDGKILIPGVITHSTNIVEHPELVAQRLVRYAKIVGRENVIAGVDCGFSSQATYDPEIHPSIVWAKFKAMAEGAQLATEELW